MLHIFPFLLIDLHKLNANLSKPIHFAFSFVIQCLFALECHITIEMDISMNLNIEPSIISIYQPDIDFKYLLEHQILLYFDLHFLFLQIVLPDNRLYILSVVRLWITGILRYFHSVFSSVSIYWLLLCRISSDCRIPSSV